MKKTLSIFSLGILAGVLYLVLAYTLDVYYLPSSNVISDYFRVSAFWDMIISGLPLFIWATLLFYLCAMLFQGKALTLSLKQKMKYSLSFALGVYCSYLLYLCIGLIALSKSEIVA